MKFTLNEKEEESAKNFVSLKRKSNKKIKKKIHPNFSPVSFSLSSTTFLFLHFISFLQLKNFYLIQ
jgi:hypothetical protein